MRKRWLALCVAAYVAALALAGCAEDEPAQRSVGASATAVMAAPDGAPMGQVTFREGPNGVLVSADLSGLSEGWHGFHVHAVGACAPDFSAAGGHLAVTEKGHGFLHEEGYHAGDMPSIYAHPDGSARADAFHPAITLGSSDAYAAIFDEDGASVIVHEKPDSYDKEAGAGGRVSCGVIERD